MHEFSVMNELVNVVKSEIENRNIMRVDEVVLAIGELTFLAHEQLKFSYGVLVEKDEVMKNSILTIEKIPARVQCQQCDYSGEINYISTEDDHFRMPVINCPQCNGPVSITEGKECQIRNLVAEIDDGGE